MEIEISLDREKIIEMSFQNPFSFLIFKSKNAIHCCNNKD